MWSEDKLSGLLDLLYAGVGENDGWQRFLRELAEVARASMVVLLSHDEGQTCYDINTVVGMSPEAQAGYANYYGKLDVWYRGSEGKLRPNYTFDGRQLCPTHELVKTEFYNDFLVRIDCPNQCGAVIEFGARSNSIFSFLRGHRPGPFDEAHLQLLNYLRPHLQRALQLHRRIVDLRFANETQSWALDQVSFGVVLLSEDGKTRFANRPATEICVRRNGLELRPDGLHAVSMKEDADLQAMIQAATTLSAQGKNGHPVMQIARELGSPLFLAVSRARTTEILSVAVDAVVAVFITDPDKQPRTSVEMLSRLFQLTPAEARLAEMLVRGNTVEDSAEQLHVAVETARSRLKEIFLKTGTSRQSELMRLLLRLPPSS